MSPMFSYDWFHGEAFDRQRDEATTRCTLQKFPDATRETIDQNDEWRQFRSELDTRRLVYLRDGFSYEVKDLADIGGTSHLVFECEPVDDQYKVGAFVVAVPCEEIARVEVFAVHPSEKPDDMPQITGFRADQMDGKSR